MLASGYGACDCVFPSGQLMACVVNGEVPSGVIAGLRAGELQYPIVAIDVCASIRTF
jgi:hypothetical protein